MPPRVTYQLRIALLRTKPPIWRRVLVPSSMYLDILHHLIQVVMGWENCDLHMFRKVTSATAGPVRGVATSRCRGRHGTTTRGNTGSTTS